jgi:hypothetical protein
VESLGAISPGHVDSRFYAEAIFGGAMRINGQRT